VCYSVAISTVFQAYLTTYLIEPGYEEPIKTVEQMLKSERKFGFPTRFKNIFTDTSDPVDSAIVKNALECPTEETCFTWATVYNNISTIVDNLHMEIYRGGKNLTDVNNRAILCELENGVVRSFHYGIMFRKGSPFFEMIDDVIGHIVEGGIFAHIKKRHIYKSEMELKVYSHTFGDTYYAISIRHLQTAFYLLMLGYVLAVVCFMTEIIWYRYWTQRCEQTIHLSVTCRHR
jgi:hypothetical protein